MSDILRHLAATVDAIVTDRKRDDSLYRRIERMERDARALLADGFDAESVALIILGTARIKETPAYRESAAAHSANMEKRHEWQAERAAEHREIMQAGRDALRRKSQRIDLSKPRNVEILTELDRNSPDGLDLPDDSTFYSED